MFYSTGECGAQHKPEKLSQNQTKAKAKLLSDIISLRGKRHTTTLSSTAKERSNYPGGP
jgi:hypothetical protein